MGPLEIKARILRPETFEQVVGEGFDAPRLFVIRHETDQKAAQDQPDAAVGEGVSDGFPLADGAVF
jgi:hypothetical protein